jgi:hypothetical protein
MTEMEETLSPLHQLNRDYPVWTSMALDLPNTITTTTTNEDYDDDLFGNNGPENKTVGLQQLTEQHHRDLSTARKEERASLAKTRPAHLTSQRDLQKRDRPRK